MLGGARVRWARNLRSRLAQDVAREAGLSVASLSRIEKADESFLSFEALSALSSALSVPMDWLTEEPRAYSSDQGTLFRANSKMTKRSQETVKTWKMLLAEMLATLDRSITLLPTTLVTRKGPVDPVEAATAVRDSMDLRSDEPVGASYAVAGVIGDLHRCTPPLRRGTASAQPRRVLRLVQLGHGPSRADRSVPGALVVGADPVLGCS